MLLNKVSRISVINLINNSPSTAALTAQGSGQFRSYPALTDPAGKPAVTRLALASGISRFTLTCKKA